MSKFLGFLGGLAVLVAVTAVTLGLWAWYNRPLDETPWPRIIQGFSFSPYQEGQDAIRSELPSEAEIDGDLKLLTGKTHAVRSYSTQGTLARIAPLAAKYRLNVAQGIWIDREARKGDGGRCVAGARFKDDTPGGHADFRHLTFNDIGMPSIGDDQRCRETRAIGNTAQRLLEHRLCSRKR
jgi:hypothetical protein